MWLFRCDQRRLENLHLDIYFIASLDNIHAIKIQFGIVSLPLGTLYGSSRNVTVEAKSYTHTSK